MNAQCHEIQLLLAQYAAKELAPEQSLPVASHVADCAACREELQRETRLRRLLGDLPVQDYTGEAFAVPRKDLQAKNSPETGFRRWMLAGVGFAAVLALAFLASDLLLDKLSPASEQATERAATEDVGAPAAWTRAELDEAQDGVIFCLSFTAKILQESKRTAIHEVFGKKIPDAISGSLRKAIKTNQGAQG